MLWVLPCTLQALALLFGAAVAIAPEHHNALERIRLRSARDYSQRHRVQLTVNITEFSGRDAWVDVSWSGVQHPSFDDWIAVLAPADASIKHSTPVKYKLASTSFSHFEHGRGSARCAFVCQRRAGFEYSCLRFELTLACVPWAERCPRPRHIDSFDVQLNSLPVDGVACRPLRGLSAPALRHALAVK